MIRRIWLKFSHFFAQTEPKSDFSAFFYDTKPAKQEKILKEVMRKATEDQKAIVDKYNKMIGKATS